MPELIAFFFFVALLIALVRIELAIERLIDRAAGVERVERILNEILVELQWRRTRPH